MTRDKVFSLAVPDGPSERLSLWCDFRGKGYPMGRGPVGMIGASPVGLGRGNPWANMPKMSPAKSPRSMRRGKWHPQRSHKSYGVPSLSPKQYKKALGNMQWTYLGRAMIDNPGDIFAPGANVPAGHQFPGQRGAWDDTCGGHISGRWNAVSYFANSEAAFEFLRCADQPGNGAGWGSNGAEANFTIKIPANHNAVLFGPRTDFADWWATGRHGRWIDRNIAGPGELTIPYTPGFTKPMSLPEAPPREMLESGFLPWRHVRAASKADPNSDRGYRAPGGPGSAANSPTANRPNPGPNPSLPKPPPPRDKQAKYTPKGLPASATYRAAKKLLNWSTEQEDRWEILYGALDKQTQIRADCKGVACMIATVTQNLDKMDWWKAAKGLAANELEDQVIGRAHRAVKFGAKAPGLGTGVGSAAPRVPL